MKGLILSICALIGVIATAVPTRSSVSAHNIGMLREERPNYTASDYIQDGLIAMWDGIENAGVGVHDSQATQWAMIYGNLSKPVNIPILSGGTWGDDCLICSGENCAAYLDEYSAMKNELLEIKHSLAQWEIYANITTWTSGYNDGNKAMVSLHLAEGISGQPYSVRLDIGWRPYVSLGNRRYVMGKVLTGYVVDLKAHTFSCEGTDSNNTSAIYIDGDNYEIIETTFGGQFGNGLSIGAAQDNGTQACAGFVFNIRLYNRVLTDAEVKWNHLVDKARFGL